MKIDVGTTLKNCRYFRHKFYVSLLKSHDNYAVFPYSHLRSIDHEQLKFAKLMLPNYLEQ